jgi:hypothetical protein
MDQTHNAGEHQKDAEHQNESLHGVKPYHKYCGKQSRREGRNPSGELSEFTNGFARMAVHFDWERGFR